MQTKLINCCNILLVCLVLVSCGKSKEETLIKEIVASLNNSNSVIISQTQNSFATLQKSLEKSETREKTQIYYPMADTIQQITNSLIKYVSSFTDNEVTSAYFLKEQDLKKLYNDIVKYKSRLISIDNRMKSELEERLRVTTDIQNENELSESQFINSFKNTPHKIKLAILINRLLKDNSFCAEWLSKNASGTCGMPYDVFQAITSQNSTHFKPNETLEIYAGVGAFSKAPMPLITIDGKPVLLNAEGVAEYKSKVPSKKGKYKKQVKIQYRKPDGTAGVVEKEIIYTVDE